MFVKLSSLATGWNPKAQIKRIYNSFVTMFLFQQLFSSPIKITTTAGKVLPLNV